MGWEEGSRVMAVSNIGAVERSGKHLTLHGKDVHSLILLFSDDKSTPLPMLSSPSLELWPPTRFSPTAMMSSRNCVPHTGASAFHQQLLKIPKTEPLFAFSYFQASGVYSGYSLRLHNDKFGIILIRLFLKKKKKLRRWSYDPYLEFGRMGISESGPGPWRISHANEDFKLSPTYPALLVVPSTMTDQGILYFLFFTIFIIF
jgi:hypothetical protein